MSQSSLSIVEEEHHSSLTLNWTISNFPALFHTAKANKGITIIQEGFKVGGQHWAFHLDEEEQYVGIYLENLEFYGSFTSSISAKYSVYLKSSEAEGVEFIHTLNVGVHEYGPDSDEPQSQSSDGPVQVQVCGCGSKWKSLEELQQFMKDGTLQFKLTVEVYSGSVLRMQAQRDLKGGLESGLGSDVKFVFVEEEGSQNIIGEIKAHKAILSLRSSVFARMFASGMTEAVEGEVKICDISPKAFRILLSFIYSGEVDGEWDSVAAELFYGADKYDLAELQKYLCKNVQPVLTVQNVMKIRDLATLYNLPQLLESTAKFIEKNVRGFLDNHDVIFKNTS